MSINAPPHCMCTHTIRGCRTFLAELGVNASQIRQSARVLGLILRLDRARAGAKIRQRASRRFADPFCQAVLEAPLLRAERDDLSRADARSAPCCDDRVAWNSAWCACVPVNRATRPTDTDGRTTTMILIELLFGMMLAAFVLLMLPFFLVMAGNAGVLFLWIVAAFAFATMLLFWLVFADGFGLTILVVALLIGLFWLDRRSGRRAY
jgi:hypothetical protein